MPVSILIVLAVFSLKAPLLSKTDESQFLIFDDIHLK